MKNAVRMQIEFRLCEDHPSYTERRLRPKKFIKAAWVPMEICDQVWVYYEFETEVEAESYAKEVQAKNVKEIRNTEVVEYSEMHPYPKRHYKSWK